MPTPRFVAATNNPDNNSDPSGGALTTTPLNGTCGEFISRLQIPSVGQNVQYQKAGVDNSDADTLYSVVLWFRNLIRDFDGGSRIAFKSDNTQDNATKCVRVYAWESSVVTFEDVILNGTTLTPGVITWDAAEILLLEVLLTTGKTPTTAYNSGAAAVLNKGIGVYQYNGGGGLEEKRGVIPEGFGVALGAMEFGLESAANGTTQVANRTIDPVTIDAGIVYSKPNSPSTALSIGDIDGAAGDQWGFWAHHIAPTGLPSLSCRELGLFVSGEDTAP